jgi:ABC-type transporter Mla subunit MlaD
MRLNRELASAKVGKRASLRKAIKNAEQAISDYNRSIKKLNDDLASVLKTEARQQDNLELAKQGISPGAQIATQLGNVANQIVPSLVGTLDSTKRAADATTTQVQSTGSKVNYLIYVAIALAAFLMLKKK